jgi:hypothetical protein
MELSRPHKEDFWQKIARRGKIRAVKPEGVAKVSVVY